MRDSYFVHSIHRTYNLTTQGLSGKKKKEQNPFVMIPIRTCGGNLIVDIHCDCYVRPLFYGHFYALIATHMASRRSYGLRNVIDFI